MCVCIHFCFWCIHLAYKNLYTLSLTHKQALLSWSTAFDDGAGVLGGQQHGVTQVEMVKSDLPIRLITSIDDSADFGEYHLLAYTFHVALYFSGTDHPYL